ncbi:hypothetical protein [Nostoc sp.]
MTSNATTGQQPTPPLQKPSSSENQAPIELDVIAPPDTGYNPTNTSVGTRTNTPLRDIPQTVNVIPQQVIKPAYSLHWRCTEKCWYINVIGPHWGGGNYLSANRVLDNLFKYLLSQ